MAEEFKLVTTIPKEWMFRTQDAKGMMVHAVHAVLKVMNERKYLSDDSGEPKIFIPAFFTSAGIVIGKIAELEVAEDFMETKLDPLHLLEAAKRNAINSFIDMAREEEKEPSFSGGGTLYLEDAFILRGDGLGNLKVNNFILFIDDIVGIAFLPEDFDPSTLLG